MRVVLRLGTVLAVFLTVTLVHLPVSQAIEVPRTLADRQPVGVGPVTPPFPIDHLGVLWDTEDGHAGHADPAGHAGQDAAHGEVRFRVDGVWSAWRPLVEDGADAPGQWASALVPAGDAESYQVRGVPAEAGAPRAVALNTTDGPAQEVGRRPGGGAQAAGTCLSRAEWGADESLRFDDAGAEIWPVDSHPVQAMTVHHTATENNDPTPDATVRAIYRYHAVDRGWGDIGYHYLIDEHGKVYEGRWSGSQSTMCAAGGTGADFAHDDEGDDAEELVTAGHTAGYNSGNLGAALLGTFTTHRRDGAEPAQPAVDALTGLLTEAASRHELDPHATVDYRNPVNGYTKTVDMISGHRDWVSTECPGARLDDDLPAIRDAVAASVPDSSVSIVAPTEGAVVSGAVTLTASAPEAASVGFAVDATTDLGPAVRAADGSWSASWDTTGSSEGPHTVTATATASDGATVTASVAVTVDNDSEPVVVITAPADTATVAGSVPLAATASDDGDVTSVHFTVDGGSITGAEGPEGTWTAGWESTHAAEGPHLLTATATDERGQQSSTSITVTVDNEPDTLTVAAISPDSTRVGTTVDVTITGTGFLDGASVDLQNGEGSDPVVSDVVVVGAGEITARITVPDGGPRRQRVWDVVVTNAGGAPVVLADGFTVLR